MKRRSLLLGRKLNRLRKSKNYYKRLYFKLLKQNGLSCQSYDDQNESNLIINENDIFNVCKYVYDEEEDLVYEKLDVISVIRDNIKENMDKPPESRRYLEETKIFAFGILTRSLKAYEFLRKVIPLPSTVTLHKHYNGQVKKQIINIVDPSKINKKLLLFARNHGLSQDNKMEACLAVDAFAGAVVQQNDSNKQTKLEKHVFIYLLCPLDSRIKPLIVHMHPSSSGNADTNVDSMIVDIITCSRRNNIEVKYVATDGDKHYSYLFQRQISSFEFPSELTIENCVNMILPFAGHTYIGDPLHLLKNARTRVIFNTIVVNPFKPCTTFDIFTIADLIKLKPKLLDRSPLAKMRDSLPLQMFNFSNSLKLLKYSQEGFVYFFVYALLVESLFNTEINITTRCFLLETLLRILCFIYIQFLTNPLPTNATHKRSQNCKNVTFITVEKLERLIPSVRALLIECRSENQYVGLYRIGTHVCENKIGNIRSICNGDDRIRTIFKNTAKYSLMKEKTSSLFNDVQKTRINQGGVDLQYTGDCDLRILNTPDECAHFVLGIAFYEETPTPEQYEQFIDDLHEFITTAPCLPKNEHISTSSMKIIGRLIEARKSSFNFTPDYSPRHKWTVGEKNLMNALLLSNTKQDALIKVFPMINEYAVVNYAKKQRKKLSTRPLTREELDKIQECLMQGMDFTQIAYILPCRSPKTLRLMYEGKQIRF